MNSRPPFPRLRLFLLSSTLPVLFAVLTGCVSAPTGPAGPPEAATGDGGKTVVFDRDIRPLLEGRCVMCHNRITLPGRTSFESRALALKGDSRGPIIVPGNPDGSRLIVAISAPDFHEQAMPPVSHRVSKAEVALLRRWIAEGVDWPEGPEGRLVPKEIPRE